MRYHILTLFAALSVLCGCVSNPPDVEPVKPFELSRYAGEWYEVARLDHRFERGLTNVTTDYRPNPTGSIRGSGPYQLAMVAGSDQQLLWILSREPDPDPGAVARLRMQAEEAGFDLSDLIIVEQDRRYPVR